MTRAARTFDVVLFGPTGVTGREVARYLSHRAPELGLSWAVAGRDEARIAAALAAVGATPDAVLHADVTEPSTIQAMVESAACVANLVGPYARYGEPVYAAASRLGRHSVDLCGETDWIRAMIDRYDEEATASGAVIVPTAGFEALPFDLGALLAAHTLFDRTGEPTVDIDVAVSITPERPMRAASDAVSGGTIASGLDQIRRGDSAAVRDPYVLDPPGSGAHGRYDLRPRRHSGTGEWLGPMFPSAFLNPPVVHRTAALLRDTGDGIFSPTFRYREGTRTASMVPAPASGGAAVVLSVLAAGMGLVSRAPEGVRATVADAVARRAPHPGEGPRPEDLDAWSYRLEIRATGATGATEDVVVEGDTHPGYKSTATMLGEAALALADESAPVPDGAGFLTPATALGLGILDRLEVAGLRFTAE